MPTDYDALYRAEVDDVERLVSYRHRGVPPSAEVYAQTLWSDVFLQFVVSPLHEATVAGLVTCYGLNERNQTAKLAVLGVAADQPHQQSVAMRGTLLFLDYLFEVHPVRKLYAEVLSWNAHQFESMVGYGAQLEGILTGHELHGCTPIDLLVYGIHRDVWADFVVQRRSTHSMTPSAAVLQNLGLSTLADLELSALDSLAVVTIASLLEEEFDQLVPDGSFERQSDEQFRSMLELMDDRWRSARVLTGDPPDSH